MRTQLSHHSGAAPYNREPAILPLGKKGDVCCPNGVAMGGEFVFVAEGGIAGIARVSVFSKAGEFITSFSNEYMKCPWSIAVHRDNVYLTDIETNSLFHFGEDEGFSVSRRVGGLGSGDTEFDCPIQVSVSTRGEVYVGDKFNDRVQILDSGLRYLRSITHPSMSAPNAVRVMGDGVYVLSSHNSYTIHVFSVTGDKISYELPNSNTAGTDESISHNASFLLDDRNNIIISDTRADQIKVFSRNGVSLQELEGWSGYGEKGGEEEEPMRTVLAQDTSVGILAINRKYGLHIISRSQIPIENSLLCI